jgi:PKD repeat protein
MKSQNVFLTAILLLAALGIGGCTLLITIQVIKDTFFRFIHFLAETLKNIFPRQFKTFIGMSAGHGVLAHASLFMRANPGQGGWRHGKKIWALFAQRVAALLFMLALACFFGLPANSGAQGVPELAWVSYYCSSSTCGLGPALVFPGGMTDNPTDRAPTWSPDGARIAFEREGEILVINVAGGNPVNISNHPAYDGSPAWSPDGSKIAFASDRDGQAELYLMNPDGSGVVQLTESIGFTGEPAWSPDGAKIAFTCVIESDTEDICVVSANGTGFVRLTNDPARDFGPAYSPDGSRIAFATSRYLAMPLLGPSQLAMMNSDGTGVSRVGPNGTWGYDPSWSPDGSRLVFVDTMQIYPLGYFPYVWIINLDGTGQTEVGEGFDPAWRPAVSAPAVGLSPNSLAFGSQLVGTTSNPLTVSLTNNGTTDLAISGIAASGDFAQLNNCGSSVAASASCTISVSFTPTATGPRSGAVTITDNANGSPHVVSLGGTGNNPPVASFMSACTGLTCSFNGSASSDPDGTIAGYVWRFGDGTDGSGPATMSHTYVSGGTYSVTLTVTDNGGAKSSQSNNVTVNNPANTPPVASFVPNCTGLTCSFDGSASSDPDGTIASYAWSFGDGTAGSGATVSHTFAAANTYLVTLIVTDNGGATGTQSKNVTYMHVGDLDRTTTKQGNTWTAIVTVTVHNSTHNGVSTATVGGSWSTGGTASCATSASGTCTVSKSGISKNSASITFTVGNVTHGTLFYTDAGNHEPDGDSNGSSITVNRP